MTAAPSFTATPVQNRLMDAVTDGRYRIIGFGGGIRGTKTFGILACLMALCRIYPGSRWAVIRKDLQRLRDTTLPSFEKLRQMAGDFFEPVNQQRWESVARNGSVILFRGENIDKDPELLRFHGYEVNGFANEEADELSERTLVKEIERAGTWIIPNTDAQPAPYIFNSFNPCASWPRRRFYVPWKAGTLAPPYCFIPTTAADNPYISDAQREAWREMPEQEYRRFVLGDWDALTGAYYDTLTTDHLIDEERCPWYRGKDGFGNVRREWPPHWRYWASTDYGYAHWWVTIFWATDDDGLDWCLGALWLRKTQDDDYALALLAETDAETGSYPRACLGLVFAGHDCWNKVTAKGASGETTADVFARRGIFLKRADIDKVNGGRAVNRQLKAQRVRIVKNAGNVRVFDQLGEILPDENDIRKPAKVDADEHGMGGDDGADAFRYGIATRVPAALAPKASEAKIDDRARPLDPRTLTPVRQKPATLDAVLNAGQPARPSHRMPTRRWK